VVELLVLSGALGVDPLELFAGDSEGNHRLIFRVYAHYEGQPIPKREHIMRAELFNSAAPSDYFAAIGLVLLLAASGVLE